MSKTRAKQHREYLKRRAAFLIGRRCEAHVKIHRLWRNPPPAVDIHHRGGRIGSKLNDETLWLGVCRTCHNWIQHYPAQARELGLIVPFGQWNTTAKTKGLVGWPTTRADS